MNYRVGRQHTLGSLGRAYEGAIKLAESGLEVRVVIYSISFQSARKRMYDRLSNAAQSSLLSARSVTLAHRL